MIGLAQVIDTRDPMEGGSLVLRPLTPVGGAGQDTITASMCAPNTGGDQGFTSIPGTGSYVLFVDVHAMCQGSELETNLQHKYVWLGALATQTMLTQNQSIVANDALNADDYDSTQKDYLARDPQTKGLLVAHGTPEEGMLYDSDSQPRKSIWKFLSGHKIVMAKLVDAVLGRNENSLRVQTAGGKYLRLDDGPAQMHMDRITIRDENKNRLEIRTGGDRPNSFLLETGQDHEFTTLRGCQHMTIMGASNGDQIRDNLGTGDVRDHVHQGNYRLTAYKDINRTSHTGDITELCEKGDITYKTGTGDINIYSAAGMDVDAGDSITVDSPTDIKLTCGASTIVMTPASIVITSPNVSIVGGTGDAFINGISLVTHKHLGNHGFSTSPPF